MRKYINLRPIIALGLVFAFLANTFGPIPLAQAQDFVLPAPGIMVYLSPEFNPPILKGIKVNPNNPFRFDFILDKGDSQLSNDALKGESTKLIKYFLASLTIPEKDLWVNLSPYEKDRIIPNSFGLTEMGRDLLAEDYMLKQITASLIYPEGEVGKKFWKRIYEEAAKKFGTTNIPVNTFNKVWIVPEKAVVYENAKAGTAYVVEAKLKVMLEQDYLALSKNSPHPNPPHEGEGINALGSQIVREIVLPELTKEVNEDKNFSQLRQVYNSLILATWYKKKIKDSILEQVYADRNKVAGINIDDPQEKEKIYQHYLQAFKKGVYNYIQEDEMPNCFDSVSGCPTITRKYFSGGLQLIVPLQETTDGAMVGLEKNNSQYIEEVKIDQAMQADETAAFPENLWNARTSYQDIIDTKDRIFKSIFEKGEIKPYVSTIRLIQDLASRGYKMGIGSSSRRTFQYLDNFGITAYFKGAIIDGNMIKRSEFPDKLSSEFYKEAARKMGVVPSDAIVFEDGSTGVSAAQAGGIGLIIGLERSGDGEKLKEAGADHVMPDIGDLSIEQMTAWFKQKRITDTQDFKGVIFDVDGVIANTQKEHFDSWKQTLDSYLAFRGDKKEFTNQEYLAYFNGKASVDTIRKFLQSRGIILEDRAMKTEFLSKIEIGFPNYRLNERMKDEPFFNDQVLREATQRFFYQNDGANTQKILKQVFQGEHKPQEISKLTLTGFQQGNYYLVFHGSIQLKNGQSGAFVVMAPSKTGKANEMIADDFSNLEYFHKQYPEIFARPIVFDRVLQEPGSFINFLAVEWLGEYIEMPARYTNTEGYFLINPKGREKEQISHLTFYNNPRSSSNILQQIVSYIVQTATFDTHQGIVEYIDDILPTAGDFMFKSLGNRNFKLKWITVRSVARKKNIDVFFDYLLRSKLFYSGERWGFKAKDAVEGIRQGLEIKFGPEQGMEYFLKFIISYNRWLEQRQLDLDGEDRIKAQRILKTIRQVLENSEKAEVHHGNQADVFYFDHPDMETNAWKSFDTSKRSKVKVMVIAENGNANFIKASLLSMSYSLNNIQQILNLKEAELAIKRAQTLPEIIIFQGESAAWQEKSWYAYVAECKKIGASIFVGLDTGDSAKDIEHIMPTIETWLGIFPALQISYQPSNPAMNGSNEKNIGILQSNGFNRMNAEIILQEVIASTQRLSSLKGLLRQYRINRLIRKIKPKTDSGSDEGTYTPWKIEIRESREESDVVEHVAHELWHEFRKKVILADAYAELRLLEEDLIFEDEDMRELFENKTVYVKDYEKVLAERNQKLYEDRHDEADVEPSWYYGFGKDVGQLIFMITGKNSKKSYRILDLMDKGLNFKEAVLQVNEEMRAGDRAMNVEKFQYQARREQELKILKELPDGVMLTIGDLARRLHRVAGYENVPVYIVKYDITHDNRFERFRIDPAQIADTKILNNGGIDLTPANLNLQVKKEIAASLKNAPRNDDLDGIRFHLDPVQLAQLQNAPGFVPVIISIRPLKSLSAFLGINSP